MGGLDLSAVARGMKPTGVLSLREDARVGFGAGAIMVIDYGRPLVRERSVWGGVLVPFDFVWRYGANDATHRFTTRPLTFGTVSLSRQREVAIRLAIGADTGRLVRQLLSESVVIALLGFALAMLFAYWGVGALAAAAGTALPMTAPVHLDARVFGILFAVALLCGLACGLAPAIFARPGRLHDVLTSAGTRTTSTRGHQRFRRGLEIGRAHV